MRGLVLSIAAYQATVGEEDLPVACPVPQDVDAPVPQWVFVLDITAGPVAQNVSALLKEGEVLPRHPLPALARDPT